MEDEEESVLKCVRCGRVLPDGSLDCFECRVAEEAEHRTIAALNNLPRPSAFPWLLATTALILISITVGFVAWRYHSELSAAKEDLTAKGKELAERDRRLAEQEAKLRDSTDTVKQLYERIEKEAAQIKTIQQAYAALQVRTAPLPRVSLLTLPMKSCVAFRMGIKENAILGGKAVSGLLAHAPSTLEYEIGGRFSRFTGVCGLEESKLPPGDKNAGKSRFDLRLGSVQFTIYGDGKVLWQSRKFEWNTPPEPFDANLSGVKILKLVADPLGKNAMDWTVWGNPVLEALPER